MRRESLGKSWHRRGSQFQGLGVTTGASSKELVVYVRCWITALGSLSMLGLSSSNRDRCISHHPRSGKLSDPCGPRRCYNGCGSPRACRTSCRQSGWSYRPSLWTHWLPQSLPDKPLPYLISIVIIWGLSCGGIMAGCLFNILISRVILLSTG